MNNSKIKLRKAIQFMIASNRIKCLGRNITPEVQNLYSKTIKY